MISAGRQTAQSEVRRELHLSGEIGGFFFSGANGYQLTLFDTPSAILNNPNPALYPQAC